MFPGNQQPSMWMYDGNNASPPNITLQQPSNLQADDNIAQSMRYVPRHSR